MKPGSKVKVHYTGTLDDGSVFDSSEGKEPLEFTIGKNQVVEGFENAVRDMIINEEKTVNIKHEEAYGEKQDNLLVQIPRDKFPPELEVGGRLILKGPDGQHMPAIVDKVTDDIVTIDLNHPLAGKDLNFKLKVISVN